MVVKPIHLISYTLETTGDKCIQTIKCKSNVLSLRATGIIKVNGQLHTEIELLISMTWMNENLHRHRASFINST